jgi:hypothetical protein
LETSVLEERLMENALRLLRTRSLAPGVAAGALMLGVTGCTHVTRVQNPAAYVSSEAPNRVWLKRANSGTRVQVEAPRLAGDTLFGFVAGRFEEIPLAETEWVQARRPATGRTLGLVFAMTGVGAAMVANFFMHQSSTNGTPVKPDCSGDEDEPSGISC